MPIENKLNAVNKALEEERKLEPHDKIHYKLYSVWVDPLTMKTHHKTLKKFWAADDEEAYEELQRYKKENDFPASVYYDTTGYYIGNELDENGKVKHYDSMFEMIEDEDCNASFFTKLIDKVKLHLGLLKMKINDIRYAIVDLVYWMKTKHCPNEHWSLDNHMIDDLIFNIPKLIEHRHGVHQLFCSEACKQLGLEDTHENNGRDDVMKLAFDMQNSVLVEGLDLAKSYVFYDSYGHEHKEMSSRCSIPYKPGTYDSIDYVKLSELQDECWSKLWDWVKKNGRMLWD